MLTFLVYSATAGTTLRVIGKTDYLLWNLSSNCHHKRETICKINPFSCKVVNTISLLLVALLYAFNTQGVAEAVSFQAAALSYAKDKSLVKSQ